MKVTTDHHRLIFIAWITICNLVFWWIFCKPPTTTTGTNCVRGGSQTGNSTKLFVVPPVQVFVVMSPAHGDYWERFYQNEIGWHTQFPNLRAFTFDALPSNGQLSPFITSMEKLAHEKSEKNSNLLLAAFQHIYQQNPNSDWYFLTEDDTIVVKPNLDRLIQELQDKQDTLMWYGKSVTFKDDQGKIIDFVVGGAGMLMTNQLLKEMAPLIPTCRHEHNKLYYGDARVGACAADAVRSQATNGTRMKWPPDGFFNPPSPFVFTNGNPAEEVEHQSPKGLVVTLHEKDPEHIRILNQAISEIHARQQDITWEALKPYITWKADR